MSDRSDGGSGGPGSGTLVGRRITQVLATSTGGVGTHVRSVVPRVDGAGAAVQVCGPRSTEDLFGFASSGAATFRPVEISAGLAPVADAVASWRLRGELASTDLVHAHGLRAGLVTAAACRLRSRPPAFVLTLHNAAPDSEGIRRRMIAAVERRIVRAADVVLAASEDLAANARAQGASDVRMAPVSAPPLRPARRSRDEVRAELRLDEGTPLVVAIGRLHAQKGYDVLLDAVGAWGTGRGPHPAPLVAIAGDGPQEEHLARRIRSEQLPVRLLGRRDDVADLLGAADLCVLPSRWEARSLTAQEALRAGTPLVATRTGGLPELLGDAAELVPPEDAGALADAIAGLLGDRERARRLAHAGRARAAEWPDEAATARQLVAVYRELLGPADGGRG